MHEYSKTRLKYICKSFNSNITKDKLTDKGQYPVFGAAGLIGYNSQFICSNKYLGIVKDGAGVGRVNVYPEKTSLLGTMAYIIPNSGTDLNWLHYCIESLSLGVSEDKTTIPHIYFSEYGNREIFYPEYEIQKKIASFLDSKCATIDSLRSKIEKEIEILEDYKKSIITEAVTKGLDKTVLMRDSGIEWIGKIPVAWNFVRGKYHLSNKKYIPGIHADKYERLSLTLHGVLPRSKDDSEGLQPKDFYTYQLLEKGELVFKLIDLQNVSTSRVGLSHDTGLVSPAYIVLHGDNEVLTEYLQYFYLMMWHRQIFNALGDNGVRSNLNATDLLNVKIPVPPLDEQKRIAGFLNAKCAETDTIINQKKEQIKVLADYKKSLIYEYVTGKKEL